jgi:hypothetical protein
MLLDGDFFSRDDDKAPRGFVLLLLGRMSVSGQHVSVLG